MSKARILVVEDESIVALDIRQRLTSMDYSVVAVVDTGELAIQKAEALGPDLVLMDIKLKGKMDGIEAADQIRIRFHIPIIYLTANSDEATLQRAKITEAFGYILKPFEERELSTNIEMALYKHKMEREYQAREEYFRKLIENSSDLVTILDKEGTIRYQSPAIKKILGYDPQELLGRNAFEQVHPADVNQIKAVFFSRLQDANSARTVQYRYPHKNGSWRMLESTGQNLLADPLMRGIVLNSRDISERVQAEEALRESEERYMLATRGANDGIWDWDMRANRVYFSPRWKAMLGFEAHEFGNLPDDWFKQIHLDDLERVKIELARHLEGLTPHFECEHRIHHKDGTIRWVLTRALAVRNTKGEANRIAGSQSDVTERKLAEDQLLYDAFHDGLTGLSNRALFIDRLARSMERAGRNAYDRYAVLFLDLDRFKVVNDSLGHPVGDQLLIGIGKRLTEVVRASDTVARLGGDEFVILLEEITDLRDATLIADRIQEALKAPFDFDGRQVFPSASIGVVIHASEYKSTGEVLRDADIAMYRAKALGRARYSVFEPNMRIYAITRLELENDLRQAMENGEFELHYQPILSLKEEKITGFEALLRWKHPLHGYISPKEFIPIAEDTGLIIPIGQWVLNDACRRLHQWQMEFPSTPALTMNINISGRQFSNPHLIEQVDAALKSAELAPRSVRLEITESVFIENAELAIHVITGLKKLGIELQIDDFGTGYSSLGYIHRFPVNTIKIDRSFISQIGLPGSTTEIVHSILVLTHDLGFDAIAEGVESAEQLERLKALNCEYGQGYYICEPMESQVATEFLSAKTIAHH